MNNQTQTKFNQSKLKVGHDIDSTSDSNFNYNLKDNYDAKELINNIRWYCWLLLISSTTIVGIPDRIIAVYNSAYEVTNLGLLIISTLVFISLIFLCPIFDNKFDK